MLPSPAFPSESQPPPHTEGNLSLISSPHADPAPPTPAMPRAGRGKGGSIKKCRRGAGPAGARSEAARSQRSAGGGARAAASPGKGLRSPPNTSPHGACLGASSRGAGEEPLL